MRPIEVVKVLPLGQFSVQILIIHSGLRLSKQSLNTENLIDRAKVLQLIYVYARDAGICNDLYEMQNFSKRLFLLSRECGHTGLTYESEYLFYISKRISWPMWNSCRPRDTLAGSTIISTICMSVKDSKAPVSIVTGCP